jgi:hypothetical protein
MSTTQTNPEKTTVNPEENKKGIENHKKNRVAFLKQQQKAI